MTNSAAKWCVARLKMFHKVRHNQLAVKIPDYVENPHNKNTRTTLIQNKSHTYQEH